MTFFNALNLTTMEANYDGLLLLLLMANAIAVLCFGIVGTLVLVRVFLVLQKIAKELREHNELIRSLRQSYNSDAPDMQFQLAVLGKEFHTLKQEVITMGTNIQSALSDIIQMLIKHMVNGKGKKE